MSDFVVTLLGTGFPRPIIERFGPSTLVKAGEQCLLFDCGRGTIQRLDQIEPWKSAEKTAKKYDKLFLTHLHSDHTTGIPDLWITGTLFGRTHNKLRIWGPRLTDHMISHLVQAFEPDKKVRFESRNHYGASTYSKGLEIEVTEVDEGFVFEEDGVKVFPFRVNHYDVYSDEPSLGYRIEYKGKSVVISGDTCFSENLIKFSRNVDLLIHEVAAAPIGALLSNRESRPLAHHTSPEECGEVFRRVEPKLAVFYHFIQFKGISVDEIVNRTKDVYDGPLVVGEDLMSFEIGDEIKIA
jgi:ribonuclease Z